MSTDLTLTLSDSEADLFEEIARIELPDATGAELKEWAEWVAKEGLRIELNRVRYRQIKAEEAANRQEEQDEMDTAWPRVPPPGDVTDPLDPDPVG